MNTREVAVEYRLTYWAEILQERKESGLTIQSFCESAGICENSYYYWQRKLREAACTELATIQCATANLAHPGFAEVKLSSTRTLPAARGPCRSQICIEVAGAKISADRDYPAEKLAVLLRGVTRQ